MTGTRRTFVLAFVLVLAGTAGALAQTRTRVTVFEAWFIHNE